MSNDDKNAETNRLRATALELFRTRSLNPGINPRQIAINCFRDAMVFEAVFGDVKSKNLEPDRDDCNPLDMAFAPNLKKTHPINLMSRTWGNVDQVQTAFADLTANPTVEFYEPFGWEKAEVNQARALFPAVIDRVKQIPATK